MGRGEGDYRKRSEKIDSGIATMRAQKGKMVGSSKGEKEVLVEHCRELGTLKTNRKFDTAFGKETSEWAEANVGVRVSFFRGESSAWVFASLFCFIFTLPQPPTNANVFPDFQKF